MSAFGFRRPKLYDLWVLATKAEKTDEEIHRLGKFYLRI
jgi:hypothetical protein